MFLATPLVASHSVKGTGAFSEAPVLFAFGAFGAETLAPSGGPGVFFRFCYSMWLFHLHSAVKIRPFFRFSPWQAPRPRHFAGYPFGASRKKASTIFYNTAFSIRLGSQFALSFVFIDWLSSYTNFPLLVSERMALFNVTYRASRIKAPRWPQRIKLVGN